MWPDAWKYGGEFGIQWSAAENVDFRGRLVKARSRAGRSGVMCSLWSGRDSAKHVKHCGVMEEGQAREVSLSTLEYPGLQQA